VVAVLSGVDVKDAIVTIETGFSVPAGSGATSVGMGVVVAVPQPVKYMLISINPNAGSNIPYRFMTGSSKPT
jgi:hypothetical protein